MPDSGKFLTFDTPRTPSTSPSAREEHHHTTAPEVSEVLNQLIRTMESCDQDPITQLTGYLVTEDPTYLPECCHARAIARQIGRDKLLEILIEEYMDHHPSNASSCL